MTTIGIIAGSGPEAGIDLWHQIVAARRRRLGDHYRGDADAPRVVVVSEPRLGASMDLPSTHDEVWPALVATATELVGRADVAAIACNTLNVYVDTLRAEVPGLALCSFPEVVADWADTENVTSVGLLGARPVTELGEWSPYCTLADRLDIRSPADPGALHDLIDDIKVHGPDPERHGAVLAEMAEALGVDDVLLACTELPLVATATPACRLIDVTELVAMSLVSD